MMPISVRTTVSAVLSSLLVLGAGMGCKRQMRSETASRQDTTRGPTPKHVSWDASFTMTRGGRRRAILKAARMEQYHVSDSTYSVWRSMRDSQRVHTYLFNSKGDSMATMIADSLVYQDQKGRLDAYGNVVVVTEDRKRLESEHLTWNQTDRKIRTHRFVRIVTPSEVVQGNGLVADEDLETYQIGEFTAEVEVSDDAPERDSTR